MQIIPRRLKGLREQIVVRRIEQQRQVHQTQAHARSSGCGDGQWLAPEVIPAGLSKMALGGRGCPSPNWQITNTHRSVVNHYSATIAEWLTDFRDDTLQARRDDFWGGISQAECDHAGVHKATQGKQGRKVEILGNDYVIMPTGESQNLCIG